MLVGAPVVFALLVRGLVFLGAPILEHTEVRNGARSTVLVPGPVIFGFAIWALYLWVIVPILGVFYGTSLIADEVEDKTITYLFVRPIRRGAVLLGKYLGLVGTLFVNLSVMALAYYVVLAYIGTTLSEAALKAAPAPPTDPRLLLAVAMIGLELALVTAVALFWSTFSSSALLSAGFTVGLFIAGQFGADLKNFEQVVESPAAGVFGRALYYLLPNFAAFDIKTEVVHALPLAPGYLAMTALYALVYVAALLVASVMIFSRRDFK